MKPSTIAVIAGGVGLAWLWSSRSTPAITSRSGLLQARNTARAGLTAGDSSSAILMASLKSAASIVGAGAPLIKGLIKTAFQHGSTETVKQIANIPDTSLDSTAQSIESEATMPDGTVADPLTSLFNPTGTDPFGLFHSSLSPTEIADIASFESVPAESFGGVDLGSGVFASSPEAGIEMGLAGSEPVALGTAETSLEMGLAGSEPVASSALGGAGIPWAAVGTGVAALGAAGMGAYALAEGEIGKGVGTIVGGVIGGIIGTVVPVIGTTIGIVIGSMLGGIIGGLFDNPGTWDLFPEHLRQTLALEVSTSKTLVADLNAAGSYSDVLAAVTQFRSTMASRIGGYSSGFGGVDIPTLPGAGATKHEGVMNFDGAQLSEELRGAIAGTIRRVQAPRLIALYAGLGRTVPSQWLATFTPDYLLWLALTLPTVDANDAGARVRYGSETGMGAVAGDPVNAAHDTSGDRWDAALQALAGGTPLPTQWVRDFTPEYLAWLSVHAPGVDANDLPTRSRYTTETGRKATR